MKLCGLRRKECVQLRSQRLTTLGPPWSCNFKTIGDFCRRFNRTEPMGDLMIESHYEASIWQNNMLDTSSTAGSGSRKSRRTRKKNRWQPYTVPSRRTFSGLATSGELQPSCTSEECPSESPRRLETLADKDITNLPDELIVKILSNLNIRDISACRRVNSSWQALVDTNHLQALSFIRRLRFQPISQTLNNYHSFTRGWLTGFSNRGKELAQQLDKFLDNKHFPKILFFNIAEVLTKAKLLTCQNVCTIPHPEFVYNNPIFSPDGSHIVTASYGGNAQIWELVAGQWWQHKGTIEHQNWVFKVSFSPEGSHLVTASSDLTAEIWGLVDGQWQHKATILHSDQVSGISFSPDGSQLLTTSDDGTAKIWELVADQWQEKVILWHFDVVRSASFSPDGSHIVTTSTDNIARIWGLDAEQWQNKATIEHPGWLDTANFSPDGKLIVTTSDNGTTKIWELVAGHWREKTTINYSGRASNVSFSPDGSHFVIEAKPDIHTSEIWGLVAGQWQRNATIRHGDQTRGISFSPDGNHLVTAFDYNTAKIWDLVAGQWREKVSIPFSGPISNAIYSPDGSHLVTVYFNSAIIWGFVGGQRKVKATVRHSGMVRSASFSPDGIHLLTLSGDNIAEIWLLAGC